MTRITGSFNGAARARGFKGRSLSLCVLRSSRSWEEAFRCSRAAERLRTVDCINGHFCVFRETPGWKGGREEI